MTDRIGRKAMPGLPSIDSTFRNGSLTAIGVVVGFSLGFSNNWASSGGEWNVVRHRRHRIIAGRLALPDPVAGGNARHASLILVRLRAADPLFLVGLVLAFGGAGDRADVMASSQQSGPKMRGAPRLVAGLGGARSGKSRHAEGLIADLPPPWTYIATAQAWATRCASVSPSTGRVATAMGDRRGAGRCCRGAGRREGAGAGRLPDALARPI